MVWPALLAVVLVALRSRNTNRLLAAFLAGSLLTTIGIGLAIVSLLGDSSVIASHTRRSAGPVADLVVGILAVLLGLFLGRRSGPLGAPRTSESWSERALARGAPVAFLVGIVFNVFPGLLPFIALKDIAEADFSTGAAAALVVGFYLVMFIPAELPLIGYSVAPARTTAAVDRLNAWLDRNGRRIAVLALEIAGAYLIVRGSIGLI
jgi:glycerol uptake facilitator-like aquaporin